MTKKEFSYIKKNRKTTKQDLIVKVGIIYIIVNLINLKCYIGQTRNSFKNRYKTMNDLKLNNLHLERAINKYGIKNFIPFIIESGLNIDELNRLETFNILKYKSFIRQNGYNMDFGGDNLLRKTTEEFIIESKDIHGDKYDYSICKYSGTDSYVNLICKIHNLEFKQTPGNHLYGKEGCPKCFTKKRGDCCTHKLKFEDFCESVNEIHKNKYSYNKSTYKNLDEDMEITCLECGCIFLQRPRVHWDSKYSCPKCAAKKHICRHLLAVSKIDLNTNEILEIYPSGAEAMRQNNIKGKNIWSVLTGSRNACGGFGWKYAENNNPRIMK